MVKLSEIAQVTGFSIPVVSRVLNPKPGANVKIAPGTRELIRRTAEKMGYRPNRNAEFLKRGQSPDIGVFMRGFRNNLILDMVRGCSYAAEQSGFSLSFFFDLTQENYAEFLNKVTGRKNCGIITWPEFSDNHEITGKLAAYREAGGKIVLLETGGVETPSPLPDMCRVVIDDFYGGEQVAEHFLKNNCQYFFHYGFVRSRSKGFIGKVQAAGKEYFLFDDTPADAEKMVDMCRHLPGNCGVFCVNDKLAVKIHNMMLQKGITPGGRVRLAGYDDLYAVDAMDPALTTVHQPFFEAGVHAVKELINLIYLKECRSVSLLPELVVRKSG